MASSQGAAYMEEGGAAIWTASELVGSGSDTTFAALRMEPSLSMRDWLTFLVAGWGLPFTVYVVIQVIAILLTRRRFRLLVALPVPIMSCTLLYSINAYWHGANLWPIALIVSGPLGSLSTLALWIGTLWGQRKRKSIMIPSQDPVRQDSDINPSVRDV